MIEEKKVEEKKAEDKWIEEMKVEAESIKEKKITKKEARKSKSRARPKEDPTPEETQLAAIEQVTDKAEDIPASGALTDDNDETADQE